MQEQPIKNIYVGQREKVICGKVPITLYDDVKKMVKDGRYDSINTFVEEALVEKMTKISILNEKVELERDANVE